MLALRNVYPVKCEAYFTGAKLFGRGIPGVSKIQENLAKMLMIWLFIHNY